MKRTKERTDKKIAVCKNLSELSWYYMYYIYIYIIYINGLRIIQFFLQNLGSEAKTLH